MKKYFISLIFILLIILLIIFGHFSGIKNASIYENDSDMYLSQFIEYSLSKEKSHNLKAKDGTVHLQFSHIKYICYSNSIYEYKVQDILSFLNVASSKARKIQYLREHSYGDNGSVILLINDESKVLPVITNENFFQTDERIDFTSLIDSTTRCAQPKKDLKLTIKIFAKEDKKNVLIVE